MSAVRGMRSFKHDDLALLPKTSLANRGTLDRSGTRDNYHAGSRITFSRLGILGFTSAKQSVSESSLYAPTPRGCMSVCIAKLLASQNNTWLPHRPDVAAQDALHMQAPGNTGSGLDRTLAPETLHLPSTIGGLDVNNSGKCGMRHSGSASSKQPISCLFPLPLVSQPFIQVRLACACRARCVPVLAPSFRYVCDKLAVPLPNAL
jgi:hypothetical protein